MGNSTCCFTGHRYIPGAEKDRLAQCLDMRVQELIMHGFRFFGTGGALGFDTMAAQTVLHLREKYPYIKLILVLPCKDQDRRWRTEDQAIFESIKQRADKVVCPNVNYYRGCMQIRNRHLVDESNICICYLTKNSGGTYYTVQYAKKKGIRVINLA